MKKNKKTILLAGGGGLLVVTSVAIAIPVVLASSNSDEQTLKEAQVALENLTADQKTVDLTNEDNQKLPSKIAPRIKSIKALNDLIKGVIVEPNGVRYTPKVVSYKDETKGEMVVEIEIKKGLDIDKFKFTITGFITKAESQADKTDVENALAKINDSAISGDIFKLPSAIKLASIKDLSGFPPTTIDDVHFSATLKSHNDEDGTIIITLIATKRSAREEKAIIISNFKKEIKVSGITTSTLDVQAKALVAKNFQYNNLEFNKEKAASDYSEHGSVSLTTELDLKGATFAASAIEVKATEIVITFTLTKNGNNSEPQTIIIPGFKLVEVIALNAQAKALVAKNFQYNNLEFNKEKAASDYSEHGSVSLTTELDLKGATFAASAIEVKATEIVITFTLTKNGNNSEPQTIIIPGFKLVEVIALNVQAKALVAKNFQYNNLEFNKEKAASDYSEHGSVSLTTELDLKGATFAASAIEVKTTEIVITFTLTKSGNNSEPQTIIIPGFKLVEVIALNAQAKALVAKNFQYNNLEFNKEKAASDYSEHGSVSLTTELDLKGATFAASAIEVKATEIVITFTLTKNGNNSEPQTIIIPGFKLVEVIALNVQAKALVAKNFQYNNLEFNKEKAASDYSEHGSVSLTTELDLKGATFAASAIEVKTTEIVITFTLTKSGNNSEPQTIIIPGFKLVEVIALNAQAKALVAKNFQYNNLEFNKEKAASDYSEHGSVSLTTGLDLKGATFAASAIEVKATEIVITFTLTKNGNNSEPQTIIIPGFKLVEVIALNVQAKALVAKNFQYNNLEFNKEKAASDYSEHGSVSLTTELDLKGATFAASAIEVKTTEIVITFTLTKNGNNSEPQTIIIPGFKLVEVIALNAQAKALVAKNFQYNNLEFNKEKAASDYSEHGSVSLTTGLDLKGATFAASAIEVKATEIVITFTLTKNGNNSEPQTIIIPGFKLVEVIALNVQAKALVAKNFQYNNLEFNKEKAASDYSEHGSVSLTTELDLKGATFAASAIEVKTTEIVITFTLTKNGNNSEPQTIIIPGFKLAEVILNAQAKALVAKNFQYNNLEFNKEKAASDYSEHGSVSLTTELDLKGATFAASAIEVKTTEIVITFTLTKNGNNSEPQTIIIPGFKLAEVILNAQAKALVAKNFQYNNLEFNKEKAASDYSEHGSVSLTTELDLKGATFAASAIEVKATEIVITFTLTKSGNNSEPQTIIIPGFKLVEVIALNAQAKALVAENFQYNGLTFNKNRVSSLHDITKISLTAVALKDATLVVITWWVNKKVNVIITYKLTKNGNTSEPQTMTIYDLEK